MITLKTANYMEENQLQENLTPEKDLDRLAFFSDAVFAIAITLLALELRVPELLDHFSLPNLAEAVINQWPKFLSYALSFFVIGLYWILHHRIFGYFKRTTRLLLWLNLLLLLFIGLIPYPTALLGTYGVNQVTMSVYVLDLIAISLVNLIIWLYATENHRLVSSSLSKKIIYHQTKRSLIVLGVFVFSGVLIPVNPAIALISWALIAVLFGFTARERE